MKRRIFAVIGPLVLILACLALYKAFVCRPDYKLYWFIPDGLRAEPFTFKIYQWAREGKLPNIKWLIENGSYGYSRPTYPGHTPTNFATLFTGKVPKDNGVADGPMHLEGHPLNKVSLSGFSSLAKTSSAIWNFLENDYKQNVTLISLPGSTPPELQRGSTIKGRWGGWGVEFPATIFHSAKDLELQRRQGPGNRLFGFGNELTEFINGKSVSLWEGVTEKTFSPAIELELKKWGNTTYALLLDTQDDNKKSYDTVLFSLDKRTVVTTLKKGEWSSWVPFELKWNRVSPGKNEIVPISSSVRFHVIRLGDKNTFRIRLLYDGLNPSLVNPPELYSDLKKQTGPMVDYVDSFPPQLIFFDEDKQTFLDELKQSFDWHLKMTDYAINKMKSDIIIHDIYGPNQMLTGRWWMGYLDPNSSRYEDITEEERAKLWNEVLSMYQQMDQMLGQAIQNRDDSSYIILSSDHGAIPLDYEVRLNNLFAKKGWLSYSMDKHTGKYQINWNKTKVIFLKMNAIYINPKGLGGNWTRSSGKDYEALRSEVIKTLKELQDDNGIHPLAKVATWENAAEFDLPSNRVGDLIISNRAGYGWIEDIDYHGRIIKAATKTGYKQAVDTENPGMWTPFAIVGPGIKKGYELPRNIKHQEQFDIVMNLFRAEKTKTELWQLLSK